LAAWWFGVEGGSSANHPSTKHPSRAKQYRDPAGILQACNPADRMQLQPFASCGIISALLEANGCRPGKVRTVELQAAPP
jgi:hypothetical protein